MRPLLAVAAISVLLTATAHAATEGTVVYRYDDGTAETSSYIDGYSDYNYRFFGVERGTLEAATAARVWIYGMASGCDGTYRATEQLVANAIRLQYFDPCAILPTTDYGWASLDLPLSALHSNDVDYVHNGNGDNNYVLIIDETGRQHTDHTAYYGVDLDSHGHSQIDDYDPQNDGELMFYVELTGKTPAIGTPETFDLGQVWPGTAATRTLTVPNTGFTTLRGAHVAITGPNAAEFTVSREGCANAVVEPGESCTVDVTYRPTVIESSTATLTVTGNSGSAATTTLTGIGRSADPVTTIGPTLPVVLATDRITGTVTDDVGVAAEWVRFSPGLPDFEGTAQRQADLTCDVARTHCTWSIVVSLLGPGPYTITAWGVDTQGVVESPGASISVIVV